MAKDEGLMIQPREEAEASSNAFRKSASTVSENAFSDVGLLSAIQSALKSSR